jgi:hypothetical protein
MAGSHKISGIFLNPQKMARAAKFAAGEFRETM